MAVAKSNSKADSSESEMIEQHHLRLDWLQTSANAVAHMVATDGKSAGAFCGYVPVGGLFYRMNCPIITSNSYAVPAKCAQCDEIDKSGCELYWTDSETGEMITVRAERR